MRRAAGPARHRRTGPRRASPRTPGPAPGSWPSAPPRRATRTGAGRRAPSTPRSRRASPAPRHLLSRHRNGVAGRVAGRARVSDRGPDTLPRADAEAGAWAAGRTGHGAPGTGRRRRSSSPVLAAGLAGATGCGPATPAAGAPAPAAGLPGPRDRRPGAADEPVQQRHRRLLHRPGGGRGGRGDPGRGARPGHAERGLRGDVPPLERALAEVAPGGGVVSAFQAARNGRTGDAYRCRNGQAYGIGLVSRWPSVPGQAATGGIYPAQDPDDPEQRAWLCLPVAGPGAGPRRLHHAPGLHQPARRAGPVRGPVRHGRPVGPRAERVRAGGARRRPEPRRSRRRGRARVPARRCPARRRRRRAARDGDVGARRRRLPDHPDDRDRHPGLLVTLTPA